ncbi:MAG: beta-ketoacyl synthase chain length factor [Rhodoferax sp.]
MSTISVFLEGVGLRGPGLAGWAVAREILAGSVPYASAPTVLPAVEKLPPAERRRVGSPVKLSMSIGLEAAQAAGADVTNLATVFSSTEADCDNTHAILEALASAERSMSPTRFHNSVHNAPAGYWSIATGSMQPSTSLNTYDATFGAGLLEAATQAQCSQRACLLIAFDTAFPEPVRSLRPIPDAMGVALVVRPDCSEFSCARLTLVPGDARATVMAQPALEQLRQSIPAARALPLLEVLAQRRSGSVVLDYLESMTLGMEVSWLL